MSQQINLYQPIFRKQKRRFSALAMLQAVGLVVAGVALMAGYVVWQIGALRSELRQAEQKLASASKQLAEITRQFGGKERGPTIAKRIAQLEREIAERERVQQILQRGIFSNTEGFSPYLVALARQHQPGVWLTALDITGAAEQMALSGRSIDAELVPRYLQKLSQEQRLSGIEFHVFQLARPQGKPQAAYVEFLVKTEAAPGRVEP